MTYATRMIPKEKKKEELTGLKKERLTDRDVTRFEPVFYIDAPMKKKKRKTKTSNPDRYPLKGRKLFVMMKGNIKWNPRKSITP